MGRNRSWETANRREPLQRGGPRGHFLRGDEDIEPYEGLVFRTAQLFAALLGMEMEDLQQELRVKVWKARKSYDPTRSTLTEKRYVYGLIANFIKDLKKESARRAHRAPAPCHIEDQPLGFEGRYRSASHDEVYGTVEATGFTLPATVTPREAEILLLRVLGYSDIEIAEHLGCAWEEVQRQVRRLRGRLEDWRPSQVPQELTQQPTVAPPDRAVVAA